MLTEFRQQHLLPPWPTVEAGRTASELFAIADDLANKAKQKAKAAAKKRRAARLAAMRKNPDKTLRESEELAEQHLSSSYAECSKLLADLREALAGTQQAELADQQARALRDKYPTRSRLTGALRKQGFLPKK